MGSIGFWMSPSARMTAASGIERQLATWPFCARSPLTSWGGTEHPGSACGRVASRPPGMTSTCSLFWLDDFMRRPWAFLADGDVLVVWKLDRLARSLPHLIEIVAGLDGRGIGFRSLTENIDTTTAGGRLTFHIFGALAPFQRDIIRERTVAGLEAAAARGREGGRPRAMGAAKIEAARRLIDGGMPVKDVAATLVVGVSTLY